MKTTLPTTPRPPRHTAPSHSVDPAPSQITDILFDTKKAEMIVKTSAVISQARIYSDNGEVHAEICYDGFWHTAVMGYNGTNVDLALELCELVGCELCESGFVTIT